MIAPITITESVRPAVLSTLKYYELFRYPLTIEELYGSMPAKCTMGTLRDTLDELVDSDEAYCYEGYYSLDADVEKLTGQRRDKNKYASAHMPRAVKCGRFISGFPFVKFVGISGSLSKGVGDESSDYDFFIVTEANRLWIARTMLHVFKKFTFIAGRQHNYCMNYFIDTKRLEIEEKNRYTAIELSSLIPIAGSEIYNSIIARNSWVKEQLPNGYKHFVSNQPAIQDDKSVVKKCAEYVLNKLFPGRLNAFFMGLTDKKWRRKWAKRNYPAHEYDKAFKTTLHVSKNHPLDHQKRVMDVMSQLEYAKVKI